MTNQLTFIDLEPIADNETPTADPNRGVRNKWKLCGAAAALVLAAALTSSVVGVDPVKPAAPQAAQERPGYAIVQDAIAAALAVHNFKVDAPVQRPAYLIIQDEIDAALAEHNKRGGSPGLSAAEIVQAEIDAALAER